MNTPTIPSEYMLFFRGPHWDKGLGADELQELMDKVTAWFDGLQQQGKVKGGQPLGDECRTVATTHTGIIADGPFVETKEAVGGYLLLQTDNIEEAVAIARSCPTVPYGISIEVRPVLDECPVFKRVRERLERAAA